MKKSNPVPREEEERIVCITPPAPMAEYLDEQAGMEGTAPPCGCLADYSGCLREGV